MSPTLPGPDDIAHVTLANGLRVLARENPTTPTVVIDGYLHGGAVLEPAERTGLSSFTASMLMRGTERRTFEEIHDAVESVGASLGVYSGRHAVGFSGKCLAEDFGVLLDVLGDVLQHPTFPADHVEKLRGERLTQLQERDNDTRSVASLLFRELAYPADHPYSRPIEGHSETVTAIGRDDLLDFYRRTYTPQGGALVVVGAVRAEAAIAAVEAALGGWQGPPPLAPTFPPVTLPAGVVRRERILPGKTQSDIVLGVPALRRSDPDYHAARVADTVLGRFGMMGRLGENVRERLGLAYYAYSSLEAGNEPGPWTVIAGVAPANVARCLEAVEAELERLVSEPVPAEELEDSKAYLVGSLPLRLETNQGVAAAVLDMVWYDLGLDYLQRYAGLIQAVSAEQVRRVAARFWRPGAYAVAIAGPERT
ncbi:MAG: insulinase family protein [Caldilineales bacterium]|nr:insulinase family protein [Caldilineales bacterium]